MDHFNDVGPTLPTNELRLHGHTNSNHLASLSASASSSEVQILYMPIASPPTPAPSPRPVTHNIPLSFQSYHASQAPPLPLSSFEMNAHNPALRREYLASIIRSCTPDELLFVSQTIAPILKREFSFSLPEELVLQALLCVDDLRTLLNASLVSKRWHRIARDESIWKAMVLAYEFEDLEEAEDGWKRRQEKVLQRRKFGAKQQPSAQASSTEDSALLQEEETPPNTSNSSPSITADVELPPPPFSYRRFFRDTCIIHTNWRHGGKLLHSHRLPIISPDSGTVTSLALDRNWVVIGLANSMIKVYSIRTGLLVRTLRGHDSGVWGVCLVSQGGYRLPGKATTVVDDGRSWKRKRKWKKQQDGSDLGGNDFVNVEGEMPNDKNWETGNISRGVEELRSHIAAFNMDLNRDGLHVMPDESLPHLIPPAMQFALGLDFASSSSHRTEVSGSSSESVFDEDAVDEEGVSSSAGRRTKKRRSWNYTDEDAEQQGGGIPEVKTHEKPFNMCYSSHGWGQPNSIIVSGGCDKVVRVWDLKSGQCIYVLHGHLSTIRSLRVLNNRPIAVTGSRDATLRVWDVQMGRCLRVLEGHQASVRCLDVFGDKVVSGSYDHTCRLWNIDTGECLHILGGHFSQIYTVAFDGVRIASGGLDTTVRVWDAETGHCIVLLQGHTALVCQLQLSPTILATGGADGRVITFSLQTYKALHRIAAHDSSVTSLQFNKDFLLTGGNDGRVRVYETQTGRFVREFSEPSESVWKVAFVRGASVVTCKRADKTVVEIWSLNSKVCRRRALRGAVEGSRAGAGAIRSA